MLESVLADVLTRVLGQYLEGIDRDSVRFGAWSGLVELRGVALRPDALAVLFETLGLHLPVTVHAGFIGLLRLHVPWNSIGTTPVRIDMHDVSIIARPVRGDGSDDNELEQRHRRIKRAKLDTDDAVREASWGVTSDNPTSSTWASWLVSDQLRAKIIDNIQIHLRDINIRFEDPFSDPRHPYVISLICSALHLVSANADWEEAFVELDPGNSTRKLLRVEGFRIDWSPITSRDTSSASTTTDHDPSIPTKRFSTPQLLKQFITEGHTADHTATAPAVSTVLHSVNGSLRLCLEAQHSPNQQPSSKPAVDLDIRFPDVVVDLDDVQYACILQTSVYFARISTRGYRPKAPKLRWTWALDQLLPGFSTRRARALRFTEKGIAEARDRRLVYLALWKSLLKARRTGIEEPPQIVEELEQLEDRTPYEEIIAFRDIADRQIQLSEETWKPVAQPESPANAPTSKGTTTSSFWKMLGYSEDTTEEQQPEKPPSPSPLPDARLTPEDMGDDQDQLADDSSIYLRVAFLLQGASVRLSEKGFPHLSTPRVSLDLRDLRMGVLFSPGGNITIEAVLGTIEAWDMYNNTRLAYGRQIPISGTHEHLFSSNVSSYPTDVSEAIDSIRSGSNPAKDLLLEEDESDDEDGIHLPGDSYFRPHERAVEEAFESELDFGDTQRSRHRMQGVNRSRDSSPISTFRVTESEFLGNPKSSPESQKYIAAFRYARKVGSGDKQSKTTVSTLDISVATLEAIVDGPKGSFLWGLKFWQPKGMAQDPIMAFLGAAAGARLAELRMELEQSLLAHTVPLQINAVILAPRFIVRSPLETAPAIVVNMGTLGVCTSDNAPLLAGHGAKPEKTLIRYSNYVLTLDDLGVYFSPDLTTAVSQSLSANNSPLAGSDFGIPEQRCLDTSRIERIIRPFSLRFILQTLRDASVAQVAQAPGTRVNDDADRLAKFKVRGNIPCLSLVLTQSAFQHLLVISQRWGSAVSSTKSGNFPGPHNQNTNAGWRSDNGAMTESSVSGASVQQIKKTPSDRRASLNVSEAAAINGATAMASYDVKLMIRKVSVELQDSRDVRLVTAVATRMAASVVKTGQVSLQAGFSLQSWSVTDGSRGSTAAFRNLIYAGTLEGAKGVSPPRSTAEISNARQLHSEDNGNFVTLRYTLNFAMNKQDVYLRFRSLNMICVRETYTRLASFFYGVRKHAQKSRREINEKLSDQEAKAPEQSSSHLPDNSGLQGFDLVASVAQRQTSIVSEFDGFKFQLVASGGAIAIIEMKDSTVHFVRDQKSNMRAWGDFGSFSIRDLTASIEEHMEVMTYGMRGDSNADLPQKSGLQDIPRKDQWTLSIPTTRDEKYKLQVQFQGIRLSFLYRFSEVIQQYVSALLNGIQPALDIVRQDFASQYTAEGQQAIATSIASEADRFIIEVDFKDVLVHVPRHSGCSSESLNISFGSILISNRNHTSGQKEWYVRFSGANFAVDYVLPSSKRVASRRISSRFLNNVDAEMNIAVKHLDAEEGSPQPAPFRVVSLRPKADIFLQFCEAQYTVLYFVLTENFAETIDGLEIPMDLNQGTLLDDGTPETVVDNDVHDAMQATFSETTVATEPVPFEAISPAENKENVKEKKLEVSFMIEGLRVELSRGWNVSEETCKVVGVTMRDIKMDIGLSTPKALMIELNAQLLSLSDLRPEASDAHRTFLVPLAKNDLTENELHGAMEENLTLTYEKEDGPPSMFLFLSGFQMQIAPELVRDLTFLAIPGWPYLPTSPYAPDIEYLGRTVNAVLSDSHVLIFAEEDLEDRRALVLTGEFQTKIEWMRGTGAKSMSLRSSRLEISTAANFPSLVHVTDSHGRTYLAARQYERQKSPMLYPTNSFIEYSGPDVDERGRCLDVSVDSILCLLNVQEVPLLRAVFTRVNRMKDSYLLNRDWKQAARIPDTGPTFELTAKEKQRKQARKSMSVSIYTPVARYLITDEGYGRFVPVLELYFQSFRFQANMPDMVQIESEVFMNLFNSEKGWWEPAIEPWRVAASMSHGLSGSRSIVVQSDQRLDINLTPTTVSAVKTVANSLQTVATKRTVNDSVESADDHLQTPKNREQLDKSSSARQPSVAAFLVKNELGVPVAMTLPGSLKRTTIAVNAEVEVGVQTEELVSSPAGEDGDARTKALQCSLSIPSCSPVSVSAAEIGIHYVTFYPNIDAMQHHHTSSHLAPVRVVWEVQMNSGVPVCIIRSLLRIVNETDTALELNCSHGENPNPRRPEEENQRIRIAPGSYFALPLNDANRAIRVRPEILGISQQGRLGNKADSSSSSYTFDWSPLLPSASWLFQKAKDAQQNANSTSASSSKLLKAITQQGSSDRSKPALNEHILKCKARQWESSDFFLAIVPTIENMTAIPQTPNEYPWLDICLKAPIILENKLPGPLSYRISQHFPASGSLTRIEPGSEGAVLAAGVIDPLAVSHLHFSGESMNTSYLALAYNNDPHISGTLESSAASTAFGPAINFSILGKGKKKAIMLTPGVNPDSRGSTRKDFRAKISLVQNNVPHFVISTGYWIRNRSDCNIEVCSRSSYYGTGGKVLYMRSCPPSEDPDNFLCLEGPYLSIRIPRGEFGGPGDSSDIIDSSEWWTIPSILDDIQKPMAIGLSGRSLELEVRPVVGLGSTSSVIMIRNSSWIVNNTPSTIQWCQSSALDSHGNCRMRLLNTLPPGNSKCIHWDSKSAEKAVHLRLSEASGQSDWIWSPAVPLDIGHSRELPAKMYRPKSHEQYIARVASKGLEGSSRALVIFPEDRQNPPYRVVNLCKERAIAFSQIGSSDRPWLLRAGKTTRYSWDNPLAAPSKRQLSIRIIEKDELQSNSSRDDSGNPSSRNTPKHPKCSLNIDVVGDRVKVLSDEYTPTIVINISVDGPTKIVTFCDEDEHGEAVTEVGSSSKLDSNASNHSEEEYSAESVLVVGWDDISQRQGSASDTAAGQRFSSRIYDYPLKVAEKKDRRYRRKKKDVETDAAVFLHSVGISVVTSEPLELMYIHSRDVRMKYDAYDNLQCVSLHIREFQIDNQLRTPPFPVMLWNAESATGRSDGASSSTNNRNGKDVIHVELHRSVTDDDILMIKTFQMAIEPLSLSIDDELISQVLRFVSDAALDGAGDIESLSGADDDKLMFNHLLGVELENMNEQNKNRLDHPVSSGRIYLDHFEIESTALRFTSVGSGSALVKAAGIMPSARALVALVLNVENCDFEFQALDVRNVFDSVHHFAVLVREYYIAQLNNQRMKLLASNALMGNPAALFDSVGTGARDFFTEPGRAKGSAEFVASVGRGSKSLLTHTVGGIVESVSSIPRAVSTGLEKAVGDNEYLAERSRIRGSQLSGGYRSGSNNAAQGLATGALSFAHGISSGVTGFVREPVQGARQGGAGGLLKGIGKAFIGGVAKPVAGAIDLVAEPTVALSRQVADHDGEHVQEATPVRAPRVFRGRSAQLEGYDERLAIGNTLFQAVQLMSGLRFSGDLLAWVELSDRPGREEVNSEAWVWKIVQRHCRNGKGRKRKSDGVEKIRLALVSQEDVVVASLDGKLVQSVPLFSDAQYSVVGHGKELHVTITSQGERREVGRSGSVFSAPWDAPVTRRRPAVGEKRIERVACGSFDARDELHVVLLEVLGRERDGGKGGRAVELERIGEGGKDDDVELQVQGAHTAADGRVVFTPLGMPGRDEASSTTSLQGRVDALVARGASIVIANASGHVLVGAGRRVEARSAMAIGGFERGRGMWLDVEGLDDGEVMIDASGEEVTTSCRGVWASVRHRGACVVVWVTDDEFADEVQLLLNMGFEEGAARRALNEANGDFVVAVDVLTKV